MTLQPLPVTHNVALALTRESIAGALARPAPGPGEDDLHVIALREGTRVTDAAVLVPIVNRAGRLQLLLTQRTAHLDDHAGPRLETVYEETLAAMLDDLNTPIALAAALKGVKLIQGMGELNGASAQSARQWLDRTNDLLGFIQPQTMARPVSTNGHDPLAEQVESLLTQGAEARKSRDFAGADAIRGEIDALGVEVKDTPDGTKWRRKISV